MTIDLVSRSESDTLEIARALGSALRTGDVVSLTGVLGTGKTVFCKGIGEALGIPPGRIVSPSFTIVTEHREGRIPFFHVDAYRLGSVREAEEIGLEEIFREEGVCAVEWADRVRDLLPNGCIRVTFLISDDSAEQRRIRVRMNESGRFRSFCSRVAPFAQGG
jgi:tRNA threonylcarbamoyladenosine biosynthesis protein TsaE